MKADSDLRTFPALLLISTFLCACSDSDSDKTVAGRTASLAQAVANTDSAAATLRLQSRLEQATGGVERTVVGRLQVADTERAILTLPDGSEVPLLASASGALEGSVSLPAETRPAGPYTFSWRTRAGERGAVTLRAESPPDSPTIREPTDMALVTADPLQVSWDGVGEIFEVVLEEASRPTPVYASAELTGTTHAISLDGLPAGRYRLVIRAVTVFDGEAVRYEAATWVVLDLAP